jgi:hypothetical protein
MKAKKTTTKQNMRTHGRSLCLIEEGESQTKRFSRPWRSIRAN